MLLEELASYLSQQHTALKPGQTLYIGHYPDQPDTIVALYDDGGEASPPGLEDIRRAVQVVVRGKDYAAVRDLAWHVFRLLDRSPKNLLILPDGRRVVCKARHAPAPLTRDQSGRFLYTFNLSLWTSPEP